jgi:hypothetical protein
VNERLKKIATLREKVEEKATREKFLMLCPSIKEFEVISGDLEVRERVVIGNDK